MKKTFEFLKKNHSLLLVMAMGIAAYLLTDEAGCLMMATVGVVPSGTPRASRGIAGLATQGNGNAKIGRAHV